MWSIEPPKESTMGDHDVPIVGTELHGKNIALLVSGGIAAIRAPSVARAIRRFGATVTAYVSPGALNYTTLMALEWATTNNVVARLTSGSEHLHKDRPFDAYFVVPATYNTINKFANGIADGILTTTLSSALGLLEKNKTKIFIAPTMHGDMHNSIFTENVAKLQAKGVTFIPPRDAYGKHNIPETRSLVEFLCRHLSDSPLKGVSILVTAGPTPVQIDKVRTITNIFKGSLGIRLAEQLWRKGADVQLILGRDTGVQSCVPTTVIKTFDDYRSAVLGALSSKEFKYGIFSAAVADYRPIEVYAAKIPSGGALRKIDVAPTPKVIDEVLANFPSCKLISFKLEVGATQEEFTRIATERLQKGHLAVIANEYSQIDSRNHVAYLYTGKAEPIAMQNRREIVEGIIGFIEKDLMTPS